MKTLVLGFFKNLEGLIRLVKELYGMGKTTKTAH